MENCYRLPRVNAGLVTVEEMAEQLGCCRTTLDRAVGAAYILAPSHAGGPVRLLWHKSEIPEVKAGLERWLNRPRRYNSRTHQPPAGLLSIGDLAHELGRPRVTLYDWIRGGLFPQGTVTKRGHLWYEEKNLPELRRLYIELLKTWKTQRPRRSRKRPRGASSRQGGG